jgi:thiol-disulfide isomerase/thioredoxin
LGCELLAKRISIVARAAIFALLLAVGAPTVSAAPLDLSALRGRVVYLDFWASWCGPCRQSFPWMESMQKAYETQGLTVLAVNVDRDRADADRFLKSFHPDFEIRFDPDGSWAEEFKVSGMPASVIIDRHGAVRFTHVGFWPAQGDVSAQQIRKLLAEH